MLKIRQTWNRVIHRHRDASSPTGTRKKKLPKLKMKFNFLSKFKTGKKPKTASIDQLSPAQNGSCVELRGSKSEDNIIRKSTEVSLNGKAIDTNDAETKVYDGTENKVTINVECYKDDEENDNGEYDNGENDIEFVDGSSFDRLSENRLSKSSFGTGPLSRASMISQRSFSNMSMLSLKRGPDTRTVWTQTEVREKITIACSTDDLDKTEGEDKEDVENEETNVTAESEVTSLTPWSSVDFGVDDVFQREPVVNAKLAAIRDRIVQRLKYPNLENCDPEVSVDLLRYPKLPFLIALNRKISIQGGPFNEEFIAFRGLDCLLEQMEIVASSGLNTLYDVTKMMLISECATSLVNSATGKDFIINHGEHIVSFARGNMFLFSFYDSFRKQPYLFNYIWLFH